MDPFNVFLRIRVTLPIINILLIINKKNLTLNINGNATFTPSVTTKKKRINQIFCFLRANGFKFVKHFHTHSNEIKTFDQTLYQQITDIIPERGNSSTVREGKKKIFYNSFTCILFIHHKKIAFHAPKRLSDPHNLQTTYTILRNHRWKEGEDGRYKS